jgi:cytoplasmic tRNA 2-thiolation protein 2
MESFRVRHSAPDELRKILLPISLGVSSVTLLHILDHHLKTQKSKTGRTGFSLAVLFVDASCVEKSSPDPALLVQIKERYLEHQYTSVALQDVFCRVGTDDPTYGLFPHSNTDSDAKPHDRFTALMNSLSSATARADVIPILRTRIIVEEAKRLGCECIVWGDTTTKLAEKTLAETAKGRGFSLPWQIADGESPFGITFNYPLRDVLKKELVAFGDLVEPKLSPLIHGLSSGPTSASTGSKNTTIDDLMKQYFESVEENFPSIVANVVRTTAKLEAKPISNADSRCNLCGMPVTDGRFGIHGWGGDQQDGLQSASENAGLDLCYGCTRSMPPTKVQIKESS